MDTVDYVNPPATPGTVQSGHWLPALRPDHIDESNTESLVTTTRKLDSSALSNGVAHVIPPTPDSTTQGSSREDASAEVPHEYQVSALKSPVNDPAGKGESWSSQHPSAIPGGDELPSDDDEERLDPAWGIKRFDSSHFLDTVHRSSTFPDFSSTEVLSTRSEVAPREAAPELDVNGIAEQENRRTEHHSPEWISDGFGGTRDPQSWTIPAQEVTIDEDVRRFEEGVPLIQAEEPPSVNEKEADQSQHNLFASAADDEDEGITFFSNINGAATAPPKIPSIDRKSTTQVLDALNFTNKDTPDSPVVAPAEASFFNDLAISNAQITDEKDQKKPESEDVDAMWAAALEDDEFLVEDPDDLLPDSEPGSPSSVRASLQEPSAPPDQKYDLSGAEPAPGSTSQQNRSQPQRPVNAYAPHQPSTSDLLQLSPTLRTTHNNVGISRPELAPMGSFQSHLEQRPTPQPAKSFVDQAKEGYKSPYDLPMDISKPRKRAHIPHPVQTSKNVAPPPRSSSLSEKPLQSPFTPPRSASMAEDPLAPSPAIQPRSVSAFAPASQTESPKTGGSSSFFEELPVAPRPRAAHAHNHAHAHAHGRYTPQQNTTIPPPPLVPQSPPVAASRPQQQISPRASDPYVQYGLRAPERLDPYANIPLQPPAPVPAAATTRYSPAPVMSTLGPRPGPSPRYSPAPPPQPTSANLGNRYTSQPTPPAATSQAPPTIPNRYIPQHPNAPPAATILPFQPRTSSPLAVHKSFIDEHANDVPRPMAQAPRPVAPPPHAPATAITSLTSPERVSFVEPDVPSSPPKRQTIERLPPRRSQTQSPSRQRPQQSFPTYDNDFINRPASAYGQPLPSTTSVQLESFPLARPNVSARGFAPELEYVRPLDDTQFDPLERWKGIPIFKFGFGGSILSTFPKHVPRYSAGSARPQIKSSPGEVSIRNAKDVLPQAELLNSFPGPLRSKSKKKDVLSWISNYLSGLESDMPNSVADQSVSDQVRRHQEKILLWKIARVLVEHDGSFDGPALKAVNLILSPEIHALDESTASQYRTDAQPSGIYRPSGANSRPDSVDPMAVEVLRKRLLSGDRQAAVFHAMDNRLWSHALVISSTMERSMWSQVVREFVRQEVKTVGENAESLSALYEIFGGNVEESIDELVPPSARAGLQMVSRVETGGPMKNALDGLNRWKETLSLVLNNRCQGDHQALTVLGKLLEDYNRVGAAHICYIFSKNPLRPIIFGGIDEEHTPIVLLGASHKTQPFDFDRDQEAIILTEIYEFATSVLATGAPLSFMPHLSVYKLQRALHLAEAGLKVEAQSYCDAIAATLKSSTKTSLYYHPLFLSELDELSNRLKQTPIQGTSSWIGKPSLEKVSGSMWTKFSSFVAGEDSDAESKGSGKDATEAGPFANVTGTPSISRSGSQSDIYGSFPQSVPATVAGSRYAPNGLQSTRSSSELTRSRPSLDYQRSPPSTSYSQNIRQYEPTSMFQQGQVVPPLNPYQSFGTSSPPTSFPQSPPRSSYLPNNVAQPVTVSTPPVHPDTYAPTPPSEEVIQQSYGYIPEPAQVQNQEPVSSSGYEPPSQPEDANGGYEPSSHSYGYEPPTETGYVPYVPEPDSPEDPKEKPKKKSFMDDDDNYFPPTGHQPPPTEPRHSVDTDEAARKRANDAAADAAFRAAAEADAAREKEKAQSKRTSSSWFGGWLAGKKTEDRLDAGASKGGEPKVYRANLGESKMKLYYDKELGKWVNPDNPDAAQKTATPPPPRVGGTPAPPTSSGGPPKAPGSAPPTSHPGMPTPSIGSPSVLSRSGTPASGPLAPNVPSPLIGVSGPPSGAGTPPLGQISTPGLAAPPRPGTATSNASSIDDLIGPATGRKTGKGGKKGGKTGRYVDVMAK